jgi:hypothetical protein
MAEAPAAETGGVMTWTPYLIPVVVLGLALIAAPFIGAWWARDFRPTNCERCGRELIGSPPMHTIADRRYCRSVATWQGEVL